MAYEFTVDVFSIHLIFFTQKHRDFHEIKSKSSQVRPSKRLGNVKK